jgi:hypothetical protein
VAAGREKIVNLLSLRVLKEFLKTGVEMAVELFAVALALF